MDIETQVEVILREAGYETWALSGGHVPAICFEDPTVIGFVHVFPTAASLLQKWHQAQEIALRRYAPALRAAGGKAWNVYSVLLTADQSPALARRIERIEEDFALTRKISRGGIQTATDLDRALLPLLPVKSQAVIAAADYIARLEAHLKDLRPKSITAFLGKVPAADVARILADDS